MLKIGWSKRDVSTTEPVNIPGQFFKRISRGILDPIFVNCLVVENTNDIVIFLSGDFVGGGTTISLIREKLSAKRPDFPVLKVIFNVTHTHCGADIRTVEDSDDPGVYPTSKYKDFMSDMAVEAILEAYDNREEGYIAYGYGFATVGHSRRSTYSVDIGEKRGERSSLCLDGHARMYGQTNDEDFAGFEGGADHFANFMYTFNKNKELTGAIINVPCPSQNSETEYYLSADYWHNVRQILYEKYGEIGILPQCAAAGDTSPRALYYRKAEMRRLNLKFEDYKIDERVDCAFEMQRRFDIAIRICECFDEVLGWAAKELISDAEMAHTVKTIKLNKLLITDEQYKECIDGIEEARAEEVTLTGDPVKDSKSKSFHETKIARYQKIIDRYNSQKENSQIDMELHVVRIGEIAFATNAFELYTDFQHQIQARSPFTQTFIIQLTDQPAGDAQSKGYGDRGIAYGYLATERGMSNLGYSANMFSNYVSPDGGHIIVEETLNELNKMY